MDIRNWRPVIDFEEVEINEARVRSHSIYVLIIFPKGSLSDIIRYAHLNNMRRCMNKKNIKTRFRRSTVLSNTTYYHRHSKSLSIEEKADFISLKKSHPELIEFADDMRVKLPMYLYTRLLRVDVKIVFESSWDLKYNFRLAFLRWFGYMRLIRRLILDIFSYQGVPIKTENLQIIETQYDLKTWYWNSNEGILLNRILNRWGLYRDIDRKSIMASSSNSENDVNYKD